RTRCCPSMTRSLDARRFRSSTTSVYWEMTSRQVATDLIGTPKSNWSPLRRQGGSGSSTPPLELAAGPFGTTPWQRRRRFGKWLLRRVRKCGEQACRRHAAIVGIHEPLPGLESSYLGVILRLEK